MECSASHLGRFIPEHRSLGIQCTGGWVNPTAGLATVVKRKMSAPAGNRYRSPGRSTSNLGAMSTEPLRPSSLCTYFDEFWTVCFFCANQIQYIGWYLSPRGRFANITCWFSMETRIETGTSGWSRIATSVSDISMSENAGTEIWIHKPSRLECFSHDLNYKSMLCISRPVFVKTLPGPVLHLQFLVYNPELWSM
jgi:hypothetical protein